MQRNHRKAFTLIELLAVMVILAFLLVVGLPSMTNLMKSGGLSAAARQVPNVLNLARQYAITQRTNARVVFAYSGSSPATNAMWYSAYTVLGSNRTTMAWEYKNKWEYLPIGAVFAKAAGAGGPLDPPQLPSFGIAYPANNSSTTVQVVYVEFGPTGAASNAGSLSIYDGYVDNTSGTPVIPDPNKNRVDISFDNLVGRIKVTRQ